MKKKYFLVLFLLYCSDVYSQNNIENKGIDFRTRTKGYLLFFLRNYGEVIFFPTEKRSQEFCPKKLKKIKGLQLRGQDIYPMHKAKQNADKYIVQIHYRNFNKDSNYYVTTELGYIPVELVYKMYHSEIPDRNIGKTFRYKNKNYTIHYIDDWDISIDSVLY